MEIYRSPTSGTPAAATTPARLAREFDHVLWRELPDSGIEVAIRRKGHVEHLQVHDDGSTSDLGRVEIPPRGWADAFTGCGLALMFLCIPLAIGFGPWMLTLCGIGIALCLVAWVLSKRRSDWHTPLGERSDWHQPTDLHEWTPQSVAQLAAVERIAEEHDGLALVRDVGAATIDVRAPRKGGLDGYLVGVDGAVERIGAVTSGLARAGNHLLPFLGCALFLGLPAAGSHWHGPGVAVGLVAGIAAVIWLARWRPEERLKRGTASGRWIEIRTRVDDSD